MRLFSASLLLPVDFYAGRQLVRMQTPPELRQYLARPERPVVLVDQRYWRDFQGSSRPTSVCSRRSGSRGQDLFIVRREPSG